jgi:hypothetical protein
MGNNNAVIVFFALLMPFNSVFKSPYFPFIIHYF